MMVVLPATLALEFSPWFLLLFLLLTNFWRLIAGVVQPLLYGRQSIEIVIEEQRLGFSQTGNELTWRDLEWIEAIDQFRAGIWSVQFGDGFVLHLPAEQIDAAEIERLRTFIRPPAPACEVKPSS